MPQDSDDITALIQEIKTLTVVDHAKSGTLALLNVIPFAGGAVASVIGEYSTHRKVEKVCDVLADLNSKLESHQIDPESHLSKDQIIEVVHETLQTAATASDERKIAALKNGLGYIFLVDDSFEHKQLLLQVLRNCTSLELAVLVALYDASDPYIVREGGPTQADPLMPKYAMLSTISTTSPKSEGEWREMGNRDQCGKPTLLKFLAEQIRFDEGATEGALRLLDGKGLARAGANLQRSDCKVLLWQPAPGGMYGLGMTTIHSTSITDFGEVRDTPLKASRTDFGHKFLSFCRLT